MYWTNWPARELFFVLCLIPIHENLNTKKNIFFCFNEVFIGIINFSILLAFSLL